LRLRTYCFIRNPTVFFRYGAWTNFPLNGGIGTVTSAPSFRYFFPSILDFERYAAGPPSIPGNTTSYFLPALFPKEFLRIPPFLALSAARIPFFQSTMYVFTGRPCFCSFLSCKLEDFSLLFSCVGLTRERRVSPYLLSSRSVHFFPSPASMRPPSTEKI